MKKQDKFKMLLLLFFSINGTFVIANSIIFLCKIQKCNPTKLVNKTIVQGQVW